MSEDQVTETAASSSKGRPAKKDAKASFFARIALFVRQIIGELKKVVAPTRKELINYTLVVLVFRNCCRLDLRRYWPHGQLRLNHPQLRVPSGKPEGNTGVRN
jgi:preprotein translocase subunit SecE